MSSKLFAFRVAKPIEVSKGEVPAAEYDFQSQTLFWQGGTRPQAVHCTNYYSTYGNDMCNAYGDYCTTWRQGIGPGKFYYECD